MPQKAMKCTVEVNLRFVICPGTYIRDNGELYVHMEMFGQEVRTRSVRPTFPLIFNEQLKFEKTFKNCSSPALVSSSLKSGDIILELKQHTDYVSDENVIAHCSSNTHEFLFPDFPASFGSDREIVLYKTRYFKSTRVTGEPVRLEYSTQTVIKEIADYDTCRPFSSRQSYRRPCSVTTPYKSSVLNTLRHSLDDLRLSESKSYRSKSATPSSKAKRRQRDSEEYRKEKYESDYKFDLLRETLRDERVLLDRAIKAADREALYRSLERI